MKVPVTVIGFGLVVFGRAILGLMRASYLKQASENVSIDSSKEIALRYVWWYYIFPILGFAGGIFTGWVALHEANSVRLKMDIAFCVVCFLGGFWLLYRQWTARVKIFAGKLTYTEGDRWEVSANEVDSVRLTGFTFVVKKRSEKIVRVPATFEHSEIILAFLKKAAVNK
jgi:hypothetical protein